MPLSLRTLVTRGAALMAAAGLAVTCAVWSPEGAAERRLPARAAAAMPPLEGATGWLNSPPLTREDLRGKVVLVDFWTYSCINCLRTLPHVRAWAQKYRAHGLVVLGVHTPEFAFEGSLDNVRRAVRELQIDYPVAVDSRHALWRAFGTRAWPTMVFVDAQGTVRQRQLGEGRYEEAERTIQRLLREAGRDGVPTDLVAPAGAGTQAAPGALPPRSGETYLGSARAEGFVSAQGGLRAGRRHAYVGAPVLKADEWTLAGDWTVEDEAARLERAGGRITYRFHARDLHLVLGPSRPGQAVRFVVRVDGRPPGRDAGSDVDAQGRGRIDAHRLYQLVRQPAGGAERLFEIEFLDEGANAYAFTFG